MSKPVNYIVVHCSDSPNMLGDSRLDTAGSIHAWHTQRGWDGIGYHYVIDEMGREEQGRPVFLGTKTFWEGAHVSGHNSVSIGICLIGKDHFHDSQLAAARKRIDSLIEIWPEAKVLGHRDLDSRKTCPNFDVAEWYYR